jgi:transposase
LTQFTVISGPERRRRWSLEQKRALVEASMAPGASIAAVARDADLSPALIYRWRRELTGTGVRQPEGFTPVTVLADVIGSDRTAVMQISIAGATLRVPNGTAPALMIAALRELRG